MPLPEHIVEYLQSQFETVRHPFCFSVGPDYALIDWWGDAEHHGMTGLRRGEIMLDRAPYLLGHVGDARDVLPFVSTGTGGVVEVHILPHERQHHVIVMDATLEHDSHQQRQQAANELRLLHANQRRLISRQSTLIGDLVEAKTELDHRRREAERNIEEKNQLIAMISHEFRTPLSSIINYADLALEDHTDITVLRKSAEAISRASRHLHSLVDTVLDDARLESAQLRLNEKPFAIRAMFDDLAAIMAPLAADKDLSFATYLDDNVPEVVVADDVCLRQLLINLLGNAVKYTESGSVRLHVTWNANQLSASVSDTGPGIALADQERIFQAFERGNGSAESATSGAGLGLTISLELAQLMRGKIELQSSPGAGCKVNILLPAAGLSSAPDDLSIPPETAEQYQAIGPATILLCDDDEDLLVLAEYYLHRAGYGLLLARDGEEAVQKALSYGPDLVLMDINTPRMSGSEAALQLRNAGFDAPIVALTASDVRKLSGSVFTDTLRKPIHMPRLLAQIQSYLS